ncbi:MAG: DGQHR domain-containing protein [Proteobacteria bacterium]|nr:DGQHR domain-containing protein [Pseudomonadota bacterium]
MAGFTLTAHVLKQKGVELYLFLMNSRQLRSLCYVTPRTKETPEEVQRLLDDKRAKAIGQYIQEETAILPNAIVVSLERECLIRQTGTNNQVSITFPETEGKYAYVLDGQHRLAGFDHSDGIEFDLPVVALYDANDHLRGKVFADINSKQVRVSDVHLLSLYYQIKELPTDKAATMDVVRQLDEDSDSPFQGRIKQMDNEKGGWATNKLMMSCLAPHIQSGGVLYGKPPAAQALIFKEYYKAIQRTWPEAWGNNKDYLLTRPFGIVVTMSIFGAVKHRCDLNFGRQYTADAFLQQLEILYDFKIELPGGGTLILDWRRGDWGPIGNRAGQTLLYRQLTDVLRSADEPN